MPSLPLIPSSGVSINLLKLRATASFQASEPTFDLRPALPSPAALLMMEGKPDLEHTRNYLSLTPGLVAEKLGVGEQHPLCL